jgi:hypothetical protein
MWLKASLFHITINVASQVEESFRASYTTKSSGFTIPFFLQIQQILIVHPSLILIFE